MKHAFSRAVRLSLCAAVSVFSLVFSGCASDRRALSCGSRSISRGQFAYELAMEKSTILSDNGYSKDEPSLWTALNSEGKTFGQVSMEKLVRNEALKLYFADYAQKNGKGLTSAEMKSVNETMESFASNFGSRRAFDDYMRDFGVNYNSVKELMVTQLLSQKGQQMLYGKGAALEITDAKVRSVFKSEFASVRFIFVNNVNTTYPNGKTVPLNDAQRAEKQAIIDELSSKLSEENFDEYASRSDSGFSSQKETQTFRKGSTKNAEYEEAVFAAGIGEIEAVQCPDGFYFFIRDGLDESWLTDERLTEIKNSLASESLDELYVKIKDSVTVDESVVNSFSFADSKYFSS